MPPHPFKFSPPSPAVPGDEWRGSERMTMECMTREPELEIRFPRELPESGWKLALESEKKVTYVIVCKYGQCVVSFVK